MRGVYTLRDRLTSVTTAKALLHIGVPSDSVIEVLSAKVSAIDDTTDEVLHVRLSKSTGTVGGGDSVTPSKSEDGDVASGCTCVGGNTAITGLTLGTEEAALAVHGEHKTSGWEYTPLPEERQVVSPSGQLALDLVTAITSCDLLCEIRYREIGG